MLDARCADDTIYRHININIYSCALRTEPFIDLLWAAAPRPLQGNQTGNLWRSSWRRARRPSTSVRRGCRHTERINYLSLSPPGADSCEATGDAARPRAKDARRGRLAISGQGRPPRQHPTRLRSLGGAVAGGGGRRARP